ncbi:MAG: flagellar hook-basal body complex protein FliE [Solirubrobacteraceae bacterium]
MPVDPSFAVTGAEWRIDGLPAPGETAAPAEEPGASFGDMLGKSLESLSATQTEAAEAAQALATGQAEDPTAVVMAVERAQLAMQLASQIRTKAVEAAQDIFHTQV